MSILLRIAYDGTGFSGWARQKHRPDGSAIRTVQGEIEAALSRLFGTPVLVRGASRTDAGVHANGQLAAFEPPRAIPVQGVLQVLADRLPRDVTVVAAWEQDGEVDVRGGNEGKRYRYRIRTTRARDPVGGRDEWHLARRLDVPAMDRAAQAFVGTHDFSAFRSAHCQAKSTTRTVLGVTVHGAVAPLGPLADDGRLDGQQDETGDARGLEASAPCDRVMITVDGHAFLHNMVRIMAGTLVEVGLGRRAPESIGAILRAGDRRQAGSTAPACGLTLLEVKWPRLSSRAP